MFFYSPGAQCAARLCDSKFDFFPIRRIRLQVNGAFLTLAPTKFISAAEKEIVPVKVDGIGEAIFFLAALFDGKDTKPLAYVAGIDFLRKSSWVEENLVITEARLAAKTIDPADSTAWAYDGAHLIFKDRVDTLMGLMPEALNSAKASFSGLAAGDLVGVGMRVSLNPSHKEILHYGVNGVGGIKVLCS